MAQHISPDGLSLYPYTVRQSSHPLLPELLPSEVELHIDALTNANIYNDLTQEQQAIIIRLMQTAYRNGQASQGAEKIDNDAVWLDGIGGIEKQPDGTWKLTMPDKPGAVAADVAARALGSIKSDCKARSSRENGKLGGRPKKNK
jgi:hypothetical protein